MKDTKPFLVLLRGEDRDRLDLVAETYGLAKSAVIRMSLVAMCRQLGVGKAHPDDPMK